MTAWRAFLAALALAATTATAGDWRIETAGSTVAFTAVQQGARFPGGFERFGGTVSFDPATAAGRIDATVDVASVDTGNPERDGILRTAEWFASAQFPQARFVATRFRRAGDEFLADGTLTLRDAARPATLRFRLAPAADGTARLTGALAVRRLDFGIGRGEWTDTTYVGNEVDVSVDVRLRPAAAAAPTPDPDPRAPSR
jgi:polyisoprenoid-binding protein YceI